MTPSSRSSFAEANERFWATADPTHFAWQTDDTYFGRTERRLLEAVAFGPGDRVLEAGCGEGGNLVNMLAGRRARPRLLVGADLFVNKLRFAREAVPGTGFVGGDATALPFRDGAFDVVLCRDVLHHLEEPDRALRELGRVCRPGGRIVIIEPNGRNPLIALFGLVMRHERQSLRNSPGSLAALVGGALAAVQVSVQQPLPVERALLHYRFGMPGLGRRAWFGAALGVWERILRRLLPGRWWAYVILQAHAPAPASDSTSVTT